MTQTHAARTAAFAAAIIFAITPITADAQGAAGEGEKTPPLSPGIFCREPAAPARTRDIDLCFALDTTGSMGGLIGAAKEKIWSIANEIVLANPSARVRIGLVAYRDRGDDYVTLRHDLTDDIDAVYTNLQDFVAGGGGDGPESVNQALREAVGEMGWSEKDETLRVVFLVGDFPPHMDYEEDTPYQETCAEAVVKGIYINTIQCGAHAATTPIWQEIAGLSEGEYVALPQDGGAVAIATPVDVELAELNRDYGETLIPYGDAQTQALLLRNQAGSEKGGERVAATRLEYIKNAGRRGLGGVDLLDSIDRGDVDVEKIDTAKLPEALQKLSEEELAQRIETARLQRVQTQGRIDELLTQRRQFVEKELERMRKEGDADGFDRRVVEIIEGQAAKKTDPPEGR